MDRSHDLFRPWILIAVLSAALAAPASATNIAWKSAVNGSWHTASNWTPAQVPGPGDVAIITLSGSYTVSVNANASVDAIGLTGGTGTRRLNVNGATLTTTTGISVAASNYLTLSSGTVSGAGTIDVSGNLTTSGNSVINSPITTHPTTMFFVAGDSLKVAASFHSSGTLQLSTSTPVFLFVNGTLTNTGTLSVPVAGANFATFRKGALDNQGTISVQGSFNVEDNTVSHVHSGAILVGPGGYMQVSGGVGVSFTTSGSIDIGASATFAVIKDVGNVTQSYFSQTAGTISGAGKLLLRGFTCTLPFNPACGEIALLGADVTFPAPLVHDTQVLNFQWCSVTAPSLVVEAGRTMSPFGVVAFYIPNITVWGTLDIDGPAPADLYAFTQILAIGVGGKLRLFGNLYSVQGLFNAGEVEFGSGSASLPRQIQANIVRNDPGSSFKVLAGSGGTRTINARLDNKGLMDIQYPLTIATGTSHTNDGTISVTGGDLVIQNGGSPGLTNHGSMTVDAGRTLQVGGGDVASTGSATVTGGGLLVLDGNIVANFQQNPTISQIAIRQSSGQFAAQVTHGPAQSFELVDATLTAPQMTVAAGYTLNLFHSSLNVTTLVNQGIVEVEQVGSVSGTVSTSPGSRISMIASAGSGSSGLTVGQGFTNNGEITLEPVPNNTASLTVTTGTLVIAPGALLGSSASSPGDLTQSYLHASLDNQGFLTVNAHLTLDSSSAQHTNSGSISVGEGDLIIHQTGTSPSFTSSAGTVFINPDRTLRVENGAITVGGGSVTGNGTLLLTTGADANFGILPQISALNMAGSSGTFPGTFNTDDTAIDLDASELNASVTNTAGHTIRVLDSSIAGTILNGGTLDVQGASSFPAFLSNDGLITIQDGLLLSAGDTGQINNGVIRVFGGTFVVNQTPIGTFSNGDTLKVYAGAFLEVNGGTFHNQTAGVLAGGGTLDMSGTTFINDGTINPGASPGLMTVNGNVTFGPTSVLNMELGGLVAGTQYDAIQISGNAALNGTLNLSLVNGFLPQPGNTFDLVTYGSHSGQFATLTGTAVGGNQLAFVPQTRAADPIRLTTVSQSWSALAASGIPGRSHHVSAYAGPSNRLIVFGGVGAGGAMNDTWVLQNANGNGSAAWSQLATSGTPPAPRYDHAAAYDAVNNRLIVFGGYSPDPPYGFSDVWVLSNANGLGGTPTWTQLAPGGGTPGLRGGSDVAYNPASNRLILFGGVHPDDGCAYASNDIWILTNANGLGGAPTWTLLPTSGLPPYPRSGAVMGYDGATNRLVLQGGADPCASLFAEARTLIHADGLGGTPTWTTLPLTDPEPPRRMEHAGIYDTATDRLVTFGGLDLAAQPQEDLLLVTSVMNGPSAGWTSLPVPPGHPSPRFGHTLSWDPLNRRVILFGGNSGSGYASDTWVLQLALDGGPVSGVAEPVPPAPVPDPGRDTRVAFFFGAPSPNPTSGMMSMTFGVPAAAEVSVDVFDVSGRPVQRLFRGMVTEGVHEVVWNGEGDRGPVASGIYYVVLRSGNERETRRIAVMR